MTVVPFPRTPGHSSTHPLVELSSQQYWNHLQSHHLRVALANVQAGIRVSAPGIRKCGDCKNPFIKDESGLAYCRDCRTDHTRKCGQCRAEFTNTINGDRLCRCCLNQTALF